MSTSRGWAAAILLSCAPAPKDDAFQTKMSQACATEAGCRKLAQETEFRAQRCREQAECTRAQADLAAANERLDALVRERESADARAREERDASSKQEQAKRDQEFSEHAQKRQLDREQRERSKHEAKEREAAHFRFLGPEGRRRELVACYEQRGPIPCTDIVAKLLAASSDDRERRALVTLNEKTLQRHLDKAGAPIAGQLLCCDGTISETCACGGKLKNCCPRRGGVCGCVAPPADTAQPPAP